VPRFLAEKCTGCAQCWTQCPDAAIPGLVSDPEAVLATAVAVAQTRGPVDRLRPILKPLGAELRRTIGSGEFHGFSQSLRQAWETLAPKLNLDTEKRIGLESESSSRARAPSGTTPSASRQDREDCSRSL
jgi:pyruvate-ferredoxin/flavodoxin oxidoreductase